MVEFISCIHKYCDIHRTLRKWIHLLLPLLFLGFVHFVANRLFFSKLNAHLKIDAFKIQRRNSERTNIYKREKKTPWEMSWIGATWWQKPKSSEARATSSNNMNVRFHREIKRFHRELDIFESGQFGTFDSWVWNECQRMKLRP